MLVLGLILAALALVLGALLLVARRDAARRANVLDSIKDAILVVDAGQRVTFANAAARIISGRETLEGVALDELLDGERTWLRRADGGTVAVEATAAPAGDGTAVVLRDDSERRRAEDALRASEERYRTRVETLPDLVWAIDGRGVITNANAAGAHVLGYSAEELEGCDLTALTHPEDRDCWSGVVRRRHRDGEYRELDTRSEVMRDTEGRAAGRRGVDRDVTGGLKPALREPTDAELVGSGTVAGGPVGLVRRPIVDGRRQVVAHELVFGDCAAALEELDLESIAGRDPLWLPLPPDGDPPLAPDRAVLQVPAAELPSSELGRLRRLSSGGYTLALDGYDGRPELAELLAVCGALKVAVAGREDDELQRIAAQAAKHDGVLVATRVESHEDFQRCRVMGFTRFQGDFLARPRAAGRRGVAGASAAALQTLQELVPEASFEDLERTISGDIGLSLTLLRYVNSAFFSLPRAIGSVREALTLLGTRTVRRWATVVALSSIPDAPEDLVALALLRGRMCEMIARRDEGVDADGGFTVGLLSVADALLDAPMEEVLESLPLSAEIRAALLAHGGPLGELLSVVLTYERGHFPTLADDEQQLAAAYLAALQWADKVGHSLPRG